MPRRPLVLLELACAAAAGAFAVWLAAFVVPGGRQLDGRALLTFTGVAQPPLTPTIGGIAELADPWPFAIGAVALVVLALARRRWLMAAVVPLILLSANVATQLLKPALADLRIVDLRQIETVFAASWPSGHSTAAMSLALCLVLVVGPRLRPIAALLGAVYAIGVGYSLVVMGHHLVSDVLGGYLVAATFTLLGVAALAGSEARWSARESSSKVAPRAGSPPAAWTPTTVVTFAGIVAVLAAMALVVRYPEAWVSVLQHPTALLAAAGIAGLGLALTTGLAHVLRR